MLNKIIPGIILSLGITWVQAQTVEVNPDHPDSYVVVKGDTLWGIAGRFLQEPWRWPEIWRANPQIEDPHLIYPGDVVTLSYDESGAPVLTVDRGGESETGMSSTAEDTRDVRRTSTGRNIKLSPEIREYEREDAIQSIPIDVIRHLLSRPLVVSEEEMEDWPYVVSGQDGHLVAGKHDQVYVRGLSGSGNSDRYSIYRKGPAYESGGRLLGYEALHVADGVVTRYGDPATVQILQSNREILVGDRLIAQSEKDINSDFIPKAPGNNVNGSIISAIDGVSEIGRYQIVILDRGTTDGLQAGHILGIFQKGQIATDKIVNEKTTGLNNTALMKYLGQFKKEKEQVELPEELSGVLMVFRTFNQISYGLIMEAFGPIHIDDKVKNL